jgi:hypothetical protein
MNTKLTPEQQAEKELEKAIENYYRWFPNERISRAGD